MKIAPPSPCASFSELQGKTFVGEELIVGDRPATVTGHSAHGVTVKFDDSPLVSTVAGPLALDLFTITPRNFHQQEVTPV